MAVAVGGLVHGMAKDLVVSGLTNNYCYASSETIGESLTSGRPAGDETEGGGKGALEKDQPVGPKPEEERVNGCS
jgi:hypothetical protein